MTERDDIVIEIVQRAARKGGAAAKKWAEEFQAELLRRRAAEDAKAAARGPEAPVARGDSLKAEFDRKLAAMREAEAVIDRIQEGPPEAILRKKAGAVLAFEKAREEVLRAGAVVQRAIRRRMTREEWGKGFGIETAAASGAAMANTPTAHPEGNRPIPAPAAAHPAAPPAAGTGT